MCFQRRRIPKHLLLEPATLPRRHNYRMVKWILVSLAVLTTLVIADFARASEEPGLAGAGKLLFKGAQGYTPAVHLESEAQVTITGILAKVILRQQFENASDEWVEGVYVFPLPENAAINYMVMEIGDRRIVAEIKEKQEAKRIYEQAKSEGKRAALTSQERPNLFTQTIANIGPQQKITIELHYHEVIRYQNESFAWRLPTTLTPRYIPGVEKRDDDTQILLQQVSGWGWAQPTDQVPDAHRITPFALSANANPDGIINPISIYISLDAGIPLANIHGSYHDLSMYKVGATHQVTTTKKVIPMDRDFEMTWQTIAGKAPDAAFFTEQIDGDDYALLMVLPPQHTQVNQALPREVIFIIDTSGSMGGTSIQQAKESLLLALSRLTDADKFNVIEFNSYHQALFTLPQTANARALQQAKSFVGRLSADGGTEMLPALKEALSYPSSHGYLKQIVFITDGSVGNETALFELVHNQLGVARLFTVGIGSAPNSYFMTKAAEFGRGTFTFIGDQGEVAVRMQELFSKLESPVMSDIEIVWPTGINVESWPARIPDLYSGEPILVSVKVDGSLPAQSQLTVQGKQAGQIWTRQINIGLAKENSKTSSTINSATAEHRGIAVRWAREKISALLDEKIRGRDEAEVRKDVLQLALQHKLMSPYTSFVAVEETPVRPLSDELVRAPVPNLMPHGQTMTAVAYPRTATAAWLHALLGSLAFMLLAILRRTSRFRSQHHE